MRLWRCSDQSASAMYLRHLLVPEWTGLVWNPGVARTKKSSTRDTSVLLSVETCKISSRADTVSGNAAFNLVDMDVYHVLPSRWVHGKAWFEWKKGVELRCNRSICNCFCSCSWGFLAQPKIYPVHWLTVSKSGVGSQSLHSLTCGLKAEVEIPDADIRPLDIRGFRSFSHYFKDWWLKCKLLLSAYVVGPGVAFLSILYSRFSCEKVRSGRTAAALTDLHADFCSPAHTAKFTRVHLLLLSPLSRGSLLSPSLSHSSLLTRTPPPPPNPGRLPSPFPGEMTLSMKQTCTNLASASALWLWPRLCDVIEEKLFGVCVCVCVRGWGGRERDSVWVCVNKWVSHWGLACVWDMQSG